MARNRMLSRAAARSSFPCAIACGAPASGRARAIIANTRGRMFLPSCNQGVAGTMPTEAQRIAQQILETEEEDRKIFSKSGKTGVYSGGEPRRHPCRNSWQEP